MAYTLQFGKTDTLASQMAAAATSGTLSSGNFTNFTSDYLVLDYDNPSKREVILCNVTGTSIASATRGQEGTSDVTHSAGANVAYAFVPAHYANGLGTIAENDAWTSYNPTMSSSNADFVLSNGTVTGRYMQLGKLVFAQIKYTRGSSTTNGTGDYRWTLPVNANTTNAFVHGTAELVDADGSTYPLYPHYLSTGAIYCQRLTVTTHTGTAPVIVAILGGTGTITYATNDTITISLAYEAA